MTKDTNVVTERRAQIFNLLRSGPDEAETTPQTKYLDDATAAVLIRRAMTSFEGPPVANAAGPVARPRLRVGHRSQLGPIASQSA